MKFSWGKGILVVYVVFLIIVLGTVAFTTTVDIDLVADDYYEQELKYQNEIDKKNRTNNLDEKIDIVISSTELKISYPDKLADDINGKIYFYRPSDKTLDFSLDVNIDSTNFQFIPKYKLANGLWKIKIDWQYSGIDYTNEKIIVVN